MNRNLRRLVENHFPTKAEMINHYKRHDVFRCAHESHRRFNHTVSVYHVLKVKQCYPHGCTYFRWKCKKLCAGASCPKKYHHVGRLCFSCRFFYDEKEINRPEVIISQNQFKQFLNEFKFFEDWLENQSGRQVEFSGTISSVKPEYILMKAKNKSHVILKGFLLTFSNCIINKIPFNDTVYAPVSIRLQNNFNFSLQDVIDCSGYFTVSCGMIFLRNLRRIEKLENFMPPYWTESKARVTQKTGTILPYQLEKCHACENGTLLYVFHEGESTPHARALFCLEGINDPELCGFPAKQLLMHTACPHDNFAKL
jgi:hypothetical protein